MFNRSSGVLAHIVSLPSPYGIGTLGQAAFDFIDFLAAAGQTYWQILPLGHTDYGNSPYQCFSSVAGNPHLIDLDVLKAWGLLKDEELHTLAKPKNPDRVDYDTVFSQRAPLLRKAFCRVDAKMDVEIDAFVSENIDWLPDYALFMALREEKYDFVPLWKWPDKDVQKRKETALAMVREELADEIRYRYFLQYAFFTQWHAIHDYANKKGIAIFGDIPMYVAPDSVDVWVNPDLFQVQRDLSPKKIAGVPPDYYSATGQLWGNPVYDWKVHKLQDYKWWIWRLQKTLELYDVIRIDHFRAFADYWEVPHDAETAMEGKWKKGPGMDFFHTVRMALGRLPIVAEDLGIITQEVRDLLAETGFPGMRVLIFGLYPDDDNEHLPHNYIPNLVAYTSTHDSATICEHIMDIAQPNEREFSYAYLRTSHSEGMGLSAIKSVWASCARIAIAPIQDVLSLGADARMNKPSTVGADNWSWRVRMEALNSQVSGALRAVTETYKRINKQEEENKHDEIQGNHL